MNRKVLAIGLVVFAAVAVCVGVWSGAETESVAALPEPTPPRLAPDVDNRLASVITEDGREPEGREVVPASEGESREAPARAAFVPGEDEGLLRVLVISLESGDPLPGIKVQVRVPDSKRSSFQRIGRLRERVGNRLRTDDDGVAEIILPVSQQYIAWVSGMPRTGEVELVVRPLEAGERRDLTVELPPKHDNRFYGEVVGQTDGVSIRNAEVAVLRTIKAGIPNVLRGRKGFKTVPVDGAGRFELTVPSWKRPYMRIWAPGFADRLVAIDKGHAHPGQAKVIRLREGGRLDVSVRDGTGRPMEGILVRATTGYWALYPNVEIEDRLRLKDPDWGATTAADGTCAITDLPARLPLYIDLRRGSEFLRRELVPVELQPGESQLLEIQVGGGVTLHGVLLDQHGEPIVDHGVWMKPALGAQWDYFEPDFMVLLGGLQARTTSDRAGRFVFNEVPTGHWLVGPAPPPAYHEIPAAELVAPEGVLVIVSSVPLEQECEIRALRGASIRGRVLDESDTPLEGIHVAATLQETNANIAAQRRAGISATTAADGTFAIGPLGRGSFRISAGMGRSSRVSASTIAHVGDTDVVLRLLPGAQVSGRVRGLDANHLLEARLNIWGDGPGGRSGVKTKNGQFHVEGLPAGVYTITARTTDGRIGVLSDLRLDSGSVREGLEVLVRPGGTIVCRYEGSGEYPGFRVLQGEAIVGSGSFSDGGSTALTLPAGTFEINFFSDGQARGTRTVVVSAGMEQELVFRDDDE